MTVPANPNTAGEEKAPTLDAISARLVGARMRAEALSDFPGRLPQSLEDAYAIQAASIARWPDKVAGWKVAMVPQSDRERLAAERLVGPIFKTSVFTIESAASKTVPIYSGGFAAVEAEFVLQLAKTIEPVARAYSDQELIELVSAMYVGVEIAGSSMADVNKLGPCCAVSDFGNNAGLLVGPSVPDWSALPLATLKVAVTIDGVRVGSASAAAIEGGLLQALRFLIDLSAKRQLKLAAGTFVSCGAVTGVHEVTVDSKAHVDFGSLGAFDVAFEAMKPRR